MYNSNQQYYLSRAPPAVNYYQPPPSHYQHQYNFTPMYQPHGFIMAYPANTRYLAHLPPQQQYQYPPPQQRQQLPNQILVPATSRYAPPKQSYPCAPPLCVPLNPPVQQKQQQQQMPQQKLTRPPQLSYVPKSNDLLTIQLHANKNGHDKDNCTICREATAQLLRMPNLNDILPNSYEKQLEEFKPFKSNLKLFSNPLLQKPDVETSNFQFARYQRFSKGSQPDFLDESWQNMSEYKIIEESLRMTELDKDNYSNSSTIDCEEKQDVQSVQSAASPVKSEDCVRSSTPISSASNALSNVWKTPVVIDPSASPSYNEVFPSLPANSRKHYLKKVPRYNPSVSFKSRK